MSYSMLSEIGTEFGPCTNEGCGHVDCGQTREMAGTVCVYCSKEIGYGQRFTRNAEGQLVHWVCALKAVE